MGKTALGLNMAEHAAVVEQAWVELDSIEPAELGVFEVAVDSLAAAHKVKSAGFALTIPVFILVGIRFGISISFHVSICFCVGVSFHVGRQEIVCLVGESGSGKSTLMNLLSKSQVFAEDKLFATLDLTPRRVELPSGREVALKVVRAELDARRLGRFRREGEITARLQHPDVDALDQLLEFRKLNVQPGQPLIEIAEIDLFTVDGYPGGLQF